MVQTNKQNKKFKTLNLLTLKCFVFFHLLVGCSHEPRVAEPIIPKMFDIGRDIALAKKTSKKLSTKTVAGGIIFECSAQESKILNKELLAYLKELNISRNLYQIKKTQVRSKQNTKLNIHLKPKFSEMSTIAFKDIPEFAIQDDDVLIPALNNKTQTIKTVSKKEIILAMMQVGRETVFTQDQCHLSALKELVGIRQNIATWGQNLDWYFPEHESEWNPKYWDHGTPLKSQKLGDSLTDLFLNPRLYSIGCYTAAKMVMIQGLYDYYNRINPNEAKLKKIEERLWSDNDPIVNLEPGHAWDFYPKMTEEEKATPGKILTVQKKVPYKHIIPGDWVYMFNVPDIMTVERGYEGSNAIYLGRNQFTDYYNLHGHYYSFEALIDKVYQWRNKVFNRPADNKNIKPLQKEDLYKLAKTPQENGIFIDYRIYPDYL